MEGVKQRNKVKLPIESTTLAIIPDGVGPGRGVWTGGWRAGGGSPRRVPLIHSRVLDLLHPLDYIFVNATASGVTFRKQNTLITDEFNITSETCHQVIFLFILSLLLLQLALASIINELCCTSGKRN